MVKFGKKSEVKKSRDALALKAGFWYTLGNFINKGLVFIATPLFARILTKEEYGNYSNFATWQSLLVIMLTLELHTSVNKARLEFKDDIKAYLSSIVVTGSCFTMLCYLIVLCFHQQFEVLFDMPLRYIHVMFLYLLFSPALQIFQVMNRVNLRYKRAITITISSSFFALLFAVLMTNVFPSDRVFGRALGYDAPFIAVNGTIWLITVLQGKAVRTQYVKYALSYSVPLIAHLLSMHILGSSDKIMIKKFRGAEEVAVYAVGYSCAMIVTVLMDSVNQAMSPWLFDNLEVKEYSKIRRTNRIYISAFNAVLNLIMLFAPELLLFMGGSKYAEAVYVLPPVFIGCGARFLYTNYVNCEYYLKKSRLIASGTIMAALTNIVLNLIFIPRFGYLAAAYTTWFSYVLLLVFHYFGCRKIGFGGLYDNRLIFGWMAAECVFMVVCEFIYMNQIVRIAVLAVYMGILALIAVKNKAGIRRALKMLL